VFDLPEGLRAEVSRLRVECFLHAPDSAGPVRLLLIGSDDATLATLRFTPAQARDTGPTISRLLAHFLPATDAHKVSDGLLMAARKVWSARN
jgi:hypothetical protein